ncbi:MAG: YtxH domain-containing protein [Cyanobacteria bacterium P01_H01_bin.130]
MARKKSGFGAFAGGVLAGAALGTVAGVLFAPRRGRDTRRLTRRVVKKSMDALPELAEGVASTAQVQATRLSGVAAERLLETLERLRVAAAAGIAASQAIALATDDDDDELVDWEEPTWDGDEAIGPQSPYAPTQDSMPPSGEDRPQRTNMVVQSHQP